MFILGHSEIKSIVYCQECKVYLCNKCDNFHVGLFQNHHSYTTDKDLKEIFTGFYKIQNHTKLNYFCKTHN